MMLLVKVLVGVCEIDICDVCDCVWIDVFVIEIEGVMLFYLLVWSWVVE